MFAEKNRVMEGAVQAACLSGRKGIEFPAHNAVSVNV
jgi:hypothetical protein